MHPATRTNASGPQTRRKRKPGRAPLAAEQVYEIVAAIPGPEGETDRQHAARFLMQLQDVLTFKPRDTIETRVAAQCVTFGLMPEGVPLGPGQTTIEAHLVKILVDNARLIEKTKRLLRSVELGRQPGPWDPIAPAISRLLAKFRPPIAEPDDPHEIAEAASAIIVPLHPAPKSLQ